MDFLAFFFSGLFICEAEIVKYGGKGWKRGNIILATTKIELRVSIGPPPIKVQHHIWFGQNPLVTEWSSFRPRASFSSPTVGMDSMKGHRLA